MDSRLLLGSVLAIGMLVAGFVFGALIGALWFVPGDVGLAGVGIVLAWGMGGAGLGLLMAALVAWRAPLGLLRRAAASGALMALVGLGFVGYRAWVANAPVDAGAPEVIAPRPLHAPFLLHVEISEIGATTPGLEMQEVTIERGARGARVSWTTRDATRPLLCESALVGPEAIDVAERLRRLSTRLAGDGPGCAEGRGALWFLIEWTAADSLTPMPEGMLEVDASCFRDFHAARELLAEAAAITARARATASCGPDTGDLAAFTAPE